jgi:hypothetical protein
MKNGQIFAHKSTARGRLDLEYLDECSNRKVSLRERASVEQQIGRKLKHFTDYASKESIGQVHAGGFLHHRIRINPDGTSTAPAQLPNDERKRRITESWFQQLGEIFLHGQTARHRSPPGFSMSIAQHDALVSASINPDQVLHSTMKKIMRKFAEKFHPGDAIGFAYGLHHDTAHPHVHVALCPRTAKGNYVGCSTSRFSQSKHKRQMDLMRSWFQEENTRWEKILSSPQSMEETITKCLDSDRLIFSPRLNHLQANAIQCARNHEAFQLQHLYKNIRTLENSLAARRAKLMAERNSRHIARIMRSRSSRTARLVSKVASLLERRSIREQQQILFKLKRRYRLLHRRYSQLYGFQSYAHRNAISQSHTYNRHQNAF